MSRVAELWDQAVSCRGTPGERFLLRYGVSHMPVFSVRFLPSIGFRGGVVACPAVLFPLRYAYDDAPVGLEALPLSIDGRQAVRLVPEIWAETAVAGCAVHVGRPAQSLVLVQGGLDAHAVACTTGKTCWGFAGTQDLDALAIPEAVRTINLIAPKPPAAQLVRRWSNEGRETRWATPDEFWRWAAGDEGEVA